MLATTTLVRTYDTQVMEEAVVGPLPDPTLPPQYVPPVSEPMMPAPYIAPPPPDQFRGEGGTAFGSVPVIYIQPYVPQYDPTRIEQVRISPVEEPVYPIDLGPRIKPGIREPMILPLRPGEDAIAPVMETPPPAKPPVQEAVQPVQPAGPIKGTVAGFDLARVPLWAWLVVAAVLGSRLLK